MKTSCALLLVSIIVCMAGTGLAEVKKGDVRDPLDDLRIEITPYVWLPSIDATSTLSGRSADVYLSVGDQFEYFNVFGSSGRIEIFKGNFGVIFDYLYMQLTKDATLQAERDIPVSLNADLKISMEIIDFLLAWRTLDIPLNQPGDMALAFDLYGGLRYNELQQELSLEFDVGPYSAGHKFGGRACWVDPVVGGRVIFAATDWLQLFAWGDVAGFGIEGLSMSWNVVSGVDLRPASWASIKLAWKTYGLDYEQGSGNEKLGIDGVFSGPWIGINFHL